MTRTQARQLAVQLIFAASGGSDVPPHEFLDESFLAQLPEDESFSAAMPDDAQREYIISLVQGVTERREELDGIISRFSQGWKITRISHTALSVLRCALYEILYMPDVPPAAAINEAVELAKFFDEPEVVSFINGILGSFMRSGAETRTETEGQ